MASDLDFNTEIVGATNNHTAAYGDFTFTGDGGANIAIMDGDSLIASPGDRALRFDYGGLGDPNAPEEVTTVSFRTTSGDDFALKGFEIDSGLGDDSIKIEGKRDGVVVATATLDLGFSSSNGGAVYTAIPDGWAGKITFTGWDNLDEVVITGLSSGGLDLDIDDIDVGPAIVPNTAPTITNGAEFALAETSEDAPSSATQVSTLLSGVGFSDEGSASGVAITGVSGEGVWQYSTDETTWTAFGAVNANASLLLSADTWVRFLPASDNATTATFSFRGWDQTTGTASSSNSPSTADTTVNGGSTAFSSSTASTTLSVSSVNDVPTATSLTQSKSFIEDAGLIALDDIVVREVDTGDTVTATLTMSDPAAGTLSPGSYGSATSTYNAGTGVWSVAGSVADVNAALANVGFAPSPDWNDTVTISTRIRDQHGTGPADGTITLQGTAVNDAPTGNVIIDGVPQEYEILSANIATLADVDGLGVFSYQWYANGTEILGETAASLTLGQAQVGQPVSVKVSYTDGDGHANTVYSAATPPVVNVNDPPTGTLTIVGTPTQGQTLTFLRSVSDRDGMALPFVHKWYADGVEIAYAQGFDTLLLDADLVGKQITVSMSYIDNQGTPEILFSAPTAAVGHLNTEPTGNVVLLGIPMEGETLTVDVHGLDDADGLGAFSYQWFANDVLLPGQTDATLVLEQSVVGKTVSVHVTYTDLKGTAETVKSIPSGVVSNINNEPTGVVTITGNAAVGETLGLDVSSLDDGDGLGNLHFQWLANGVPIPDATGNTLQVQTDLAGQTITVGISYTDAMGTVEKVLSTPITVVAAPTPPPPPPPPAPTPPTPPATPNETVDGVPVGIGEVNNGDGTTSRVVTIPIVTADRAEQVGNNTVADIPLVTTGTAGEALLSAQVPTGYGLQVTGTGAPVAVGSGLTGLIREIQAHTQAGSDDQSLLTGGGSGFLGALPQTAPLLVQTLVPSVPIGTVPTGPLVINGNPGASSPASTALVIDTTALPSGILLELNNVDFAAVIGTATITGGAGSQRVWGDSASQTIVLGADDDVLHGGAGNDTVGSKGGDDMLFGDAGDDVVFGGDGNDRLSGGTGNDQLDGETGVDVARFETRFDQATLTWNDDGTLTVTTAATGTDTLQNIELLRFDDRVVLAKAPELINAPIMIFEESYYLANNTDVAEAVARGDYASGYAHYVQYGASEGRNTAERGVAFDEAYYLSKNPDVASAVERGDFRSGYEHYAMYGQSEGRSVSDSTPAFDEAFYLAQNPDVAAAIQAGDIIDAYTHYSLYGQAEGRDPNALFDESWYLEVNSDVAAAVGQGDFDSGYEHYLAYGWGEKRDPSAWMDLEAYQSAHPDVAAAGMDPLMHYLMWGSTEGRVVSANDGDLWG